MDAQAVVASTRDPAFVVRLDGSIVAWNDAAETFLGYRRQEVLGHSCWEVVRGRDGYGNRYCGKHCPLRDYALRGEAMHPAQFEFRRAGGEKVRVGSSSMVLEARSRAEASLVHILRPAEPQERGDASGRGDPRAAGNRVRLSARQREILRLLDRGRGTEEISELLNISTSTTRNHIQGILSALKVHNRLAATGLARRIGLL